MCSTYTKSEAMSRTTLSSCLSLPEESYYPLRNLQHSILWYHLQTFSCCLRSSPAIHSAHDQYPSRKVVLYYNSHPSAKKKTINPLENLKSLPDITNCINLTNKHLRDCIKRFLVVQIDHVYHVTCVIVVRSKFRKLQVHSLYMTWLLQGHAGLHWVSSCHTDTPLNCL